MFGISLELTQKINQISLLYLNWIDSVQVRDKFLHKFKEYNVNNPSHTFSTKHLKYSGEEKQIYMSQSLTYLYYFSAREIAKVKEYEFCWANRRIV